MANSRHASPLALGITIFTTLMSDTADTPLQMHPSFDGLLDSFRNVIASLTWLKASSGQAQSFFSPYPYVIELSCTVSEQLIKINKSILTLIQNEGFNQETPLFSKTLTDFYRILTIAVKDIVWEETDFKNLLQTDPLQFLRHIRNACAHQNKFFFGHGRERENTLKKLPVTWRSKVIDVSLENSPLFMSFMGPGDLFLLLSDISNLVKKHRP
jgi:hypothetical protein